MGTAIRSGRRGALQGRFVLSTHSECTHLQVCNGKVNTREGGQTASVHTHSQVHGLEWTGHCSWTKLREPARDCPFMRQGSHPARPSWPGPRVSHRRPARRQAQESTAGKCAAVQVHLELQILRSVGGTGDQSTCFPATGTGQPPNEEDCILQNSQDRKPGEHSRSTNNSDT